LDVDRLPINYLVISEMPKLFQPVRRMRKSYGAAPVLRESGGELRSSASSPSLPSAATLVAGEI
jgi:hypothetical protein